MRNITNDFKALNFKTFAQNMRKRREEMNLTQAEMAEQIDRSRRWVLDVEGERRVPGFEDVVNICNVLDCEIDYLFGRNDYTRDIYKIIHEMTGLTEKTVKSLETINNEISKDFPSGNIMIMLNLLLSDYEIVKDDIEGDEFKCYQLVYLLNALAEGLRTGYYVPLDYDNNIIENAKTGERWTTFTGEEHLSIALKNHNMAFKYHREAALHEIYEYFNGFFDRIEPKKNKKNII